MDERGEEIAVSNEGDREGGARSKEPVKENIGSVCEEVMGLPGRGSVVAPVDEVSVFFFRELQSSQNQDRTTSRTGTKQNQNNQSRGEARASASALTKRQGG